ncbi:MAG: NAD-glutamate dehydrogenase, partial [Actinomycetia bacterium]|nr:NAD-glutamate dehydrogenase [Actinomycetes bacterium]
AAVIDDVETHVLRDNYEQNVLLGVARVIGWQMISVHGRFVASLEASGELDRAIEFLPTHKQFFDREETGEGLHSPELAVMAAYAKISLTQQLENSSVPDEAWFQRELASYFPPLVVRRFADLLPEHPLRREIITTMIVNEMINKTGSTFIFRAVEETGADPAVITRAYAAVREIFDLSGLWAAIEALDNTVPTAAQHAAYGVLRRLIDRATRWLIETRYPVTDVATEVDRFTPTLRELAPHVSELLRGQAREFSAQDADRLVALGLPRELAERLAPLLYVFMLLDVVEIADATGLPAAEVADLHFALYDRFSIDRLLTKITDLPRGDRWSTLARGAIRHDAYAALSAITSAIIRGSSPGVTAAERTQTWEEANADRVARIRGTAREALARDHVDLATLSVALRVLRTLPN